MTASLANQGRVESTGRGFTQTSYSIFSDLCGAGPGSPSLHVELLSGAQHPAKDVPGLEGASPAASQGRLDHTAGEHRNLRGLPSHWGTSPP